MTAWTSTVSSRGSAQRDEVLLTTYPGTSTDSDSSSQNEYVAFISGLDVGSSPASEAQTQVLADYLTGACGNCDSQSFASQISRLVVLGNSLAPLGPTSGAIDEEKEKEKEDKKSVRSRVGRRLALLWPDRDRPIAPSWERQCVFLTTSHPEPLCPTARLVPIGCNSHPPGGIRSLGVDPSSTGLPTGHVWPRFLIRVLLLRNESHIYPPSLFKSYARKWGRNRSGGLGLLGDYPNDIGNIWTTAQ